MESLKFESGLADLVLSEQKNCTWRLWNDKQLTVGDEIKLIRRPEMAVFAHAIITALAEKTMGELTHEDKVGHEEFETDEEMYDTYSHYYNRPVNSESPVTIIHFQLTEA